MVTRGVIRKVRSPQRQALLKRYSQSRRELIAIVQKEADAVQQDFESVVSDWSDENTPRFVQVKVSTEQRFSITVRPDRRQKAARIFTYVDKGTEPHVITPKKPGGALVFQAGYLPKTAPIVGGGGRAIGDRVFTKKVHHPGTEPRDFSDKIHAKSAKRFRRDIENALRRLARKV